MSGQLRRSGRNRGPPTATARMRVVSQLTNISTYVPAATTPISTPDSMNTQVQAMTSNAPSSVDMPLGNFSSNPSTTTIIIPTWGPTVSAISTVALVIQIKLLVCVCPHLHVHLHWEVLLASQIKLKACTQILRLM